MELYPLTNLIIGEGLCLLGIRLELQVIHKFIIFYYAINMRILELKLFILFNFYVISGVRLVSHCANRLIQENQQFALLAACAAGGQVSYSYLNFSIFLRMII